MNTTATTTDEYLATLPAWQSQNLKGFRNAIHAVLPHVREEIKWGVPVFYDGKTMLFAMLLSRRIRSIISLGMVRYWKTMVSYLIMGSTLRSLEG